MDFRSLDVGGAVRRTADADALTFRPVHPEEGERFTNGGGEPLELTLADPNSLENRRDLVALRIEFPDVDPDEGIDPKADEAEREERRRANILRAAENEVARKRGMLARMVTGWNLVFPKGHDQAGEAIPFTVGHAVEFFDIYTTVAAVTTIRIAELMGEVGNGQRGSAGGPRKTDGSPARTKKRGKAAAS